MPRTKRDRVPFICPNCDTRAYSRPSNQLVCGLCFLKLQPQLPADYPKALDAPKPNAPKVAPLLLKLNDLALPPIIRQRLEQLEQRGPAAPQPKRPFAVVRQLKWKAELEAVAVHCHQWLEHWADELQGLKPTARIQRYLADLAAANDQVFQANGWNSTVAPVFGVSREAVRQAKNAWQARRSNADQLAIPATCRDGQGVVA
jgi:hypothetical protein